jgi:hypothetical protein
MIIEGSLITGIVVAEGGAGVVVDSSAAEAHSEAVAAHLSPPPPPHLGTEKVGWFVVRSVCIQYTANILSSIIDIDHCQFVDVS